MERTIIRLQKTIYDKNRSLSQFEIQSTRSRTIVPHPRCDDLGTKTIGAKLPFGWISICPFPELTSFAPLLFEKTPAIDILPTTISSSLSDIEESLPDADEVFKYMDFDDGDDDSTSKISGDDMFAAMKISANVVNDGAEEVNGTSSHRNHQYSSNSALDYSNEAKLSNGARENNRQMGKNGRGRKNKKKRTTIKGAPPSSSSSSSADTPSEKRKKRENQPHPFPQKTIALYLRDILSNDDSSKELQGPTKKQLHASVDLQEDLKRLMNEAKNLPLGNKYSCTCGELITLSCSRRGKKDNNRSLSNFAKHLLNTCSHGLIRHKAEITRLASAKISMKNHRVQRGGRGETQTPAAIRQNTSDGSTMRATSGHDCDAADVEGIFKVNVPCPSPAVSLLIADSGLPVSAARTGDGVGEVEGKSDAGTTTRRPSSYRFPLMNRTFRGAAAMKTWMERARCRQRRSKRGFCNNNVGDSKFGSGPASGGAKRRRMEEDRYSSSPSQQQQCWHTMAPTSYLLPTSPPASAVAGESKAAGLVSNSPVFFSNAAGGREDGTEHCDRRDREMWPRRRSRGFCETAFCPTPRGDIIGALPPSNDEH
eukprot:jgi/Bigna1/83142/fgenesh1_pg.102_\